jgi:hypothetical protein
MQVDKKKLYDRLAAAQSNHETSLAKEDTETHLLVTGAVQRPQEKKLNKDKHLLVLASILKDPELDVKTQQLALSWLLRDRELNILEWLTKTLSSSLVASFLFIGVAIVNPSVDKDFVKEVVPPLVTAQATLLGGAYGAYAFRSKQKMKR